LKEKKCTKVASHKHQSIQMKKIGTSGIILKIRTVFSKADR